MQKSTFLKNILPLVALVASSVLVGCSTDVDPNKPVDAPGYYNGPMNPKGDVGSTDEKPTGGATTG